MRANAGPYPMPAAAGGHPHRDAGEEGTEAGPGRPGAGGGRPPQPQVGQQEADERTGQAHPERNEQRQLQTSSREQHGQQRWREHADKGGEGFGPGMDLSGCVGDGQVSGHIPGEGTQDAAVG